MNKSKVFHVEFQKNGSHFYFGSIAAIFELFKSEDIGATQHYLYDFDIEPGREYKNSKVIIRKGQLYRKQGNRKRPSK